MSNGATLSKLLELSYFHDDYYSYCVCRSRRWVQSVTRHTITGSRSGEDFSIQFKRIGGYKSGPATFLGLSGRLFGSTSASVEEPRDIPMTHGCGRRTNYINLRRARLILEVLSPIAKSSLTAMKGRSISVARDFTNGNLPPTGVAYRHKQSVTVI